MDRRVVHVDINSYFATMLQQENPLLRGKPIGVLKGAGRSCVIASSNEAKKFGVKTGCSAQEAKMLCKDLIFVPAHFELCLSATHNLKDIFYTLCPDVKIFSLDEAFLDLTSCDLLYPDAREFGVLIQRKIKEKLGIWVQCNVGIGKNHLLAKMASEVAPKGSILEIDNQNLDEVLSSTSFTDVCGVGRRLQKKLHALGVYTPYAINLIDDDTLRAYFGPFWSKELRCIGLGEETHFFSHGRKIGQMQSVGRSITGYKPCTDEEEIKRVILNLLEEAVYKMRRMGLAGQAVGIGLSGSGEYWGKFARLGDYVQHTKPLFEQIYYKFYKNWRRTFSIIKWQVVIGNLRPISQIPENWLPDWNKEERLSKAVDAVNNRFGLFKLHRATLNRKEIIRPEVTGFLGDRLYHGL